MKSMRLRILAGIVLVNGMAAALSYALLRGAADGAMASVMAMHAALVFLSSLIVWTGTGGREKSIARLAEFLRGLSIGRHDGRLEVSTYGDLEDVARAANEIAAAHSERDDPAIGSVKSKKRDAPVALPTPEPARVGRLPSFPRGVVATTTDEKTATVESAKGPDSAALGAGDDKVEKRRPRRGVDSEHPEIGPVRVIQRRQPKDEPAPASESTAMAPPVEEPSPAVATTPAQKGSTSSTDGPAAGPAAEVRREEEPHVESAPVDADADTASSRSIVDVLPAREIDSAPHPRPELLSKSSAATDALSEPPVRENAPLDDARTSRLLQSDDGNDTTIDEAQPAATIPVTPADDERALLRVLFDEYILTKKAHDEPVVDLEFEAFANALSEERIKLIDAHRCRDVRFEIKVQNGEVSLLPRLIR